MTGKRKENITFRQYIVYDKSNITYLHSCIVHELYISGKMKGGLESKDRIFGKPKVKVGSLEPCGRCGRGQGGAGVNGV